MFTRCGAFSHIVPVQLSTLLLKPFEWFGNGSL